MQAANDPLGALEFEDVRKQIAQHGAVQWMQTATLVYHANTSCVDGRDDRRIIGAPNGDMGEFVLTLTATLGHLAQGLPIFSVRFARDRSFEVDHVGEVG